MTDHVKHLESLGVTRTAEVKRDADIAKANTSRDAGIAVGFFFFQGFLSNLLSLYRNPDNSCLKFTNSTMASF